MGGHPETHLQVRLPLGRRTGRRWNAHPEPRPPRRPRMCLHQDEHRQVRELSRRRQPGWAHPPHRWCPSPRPLTAERTGTDRTPDRWTRRPGRRCRRRAPRRQPIGRARISAPRAPGWTRRKGPGARGRGDHRATLSRGRHSTRDAGKCPVHSLRESHGCWRQRSRCWPASTKSGINLPPAAEPPGSPPLQGPRGHHQHHQHRERCPPRSTRSCRAGCDRPL